jgi:hypothetical protein
MQQMPYSQRRSRRRLDEIWNEAARTRLANVRERLQVGPNEYLPDEVLLLEAREQFGPRTPPPGARFVRPAPRHAENWFAYRLMGLGETAEDRIWLYNFVRAGRPGRVMGLAPSSRQRRGSRTRRRAA